jgi:myo-inositol-1(or 4)-monophosphatase
MNSYTNILQVIRSTREKSLPHWGNVEVQLKKSDKPVDVVTKIDFEIEEYLAKEFERIDPSISFVGEEYGGDRSSHKYWLVDPIDGTAHFVRGIPFCTTMIALIENGEVVFSAIYDFINDHLYHAEKGRGAFINGDQRISVSSRNLQDAYIFFESNLGVDHNLEDYLNFKKRTNILNTYNAGYEFILVATGKMEGRICKDPYGKDYDFAPGTLLVSEAGGIVTNIGTNTFDFTNLNFLATNRVVHEQLTSGPDAVFPINSK